MRSYRPQELFDKNGILRPELQSIDSLPGCETNPLAGHFRSLHGRIDPTFAGERPMIGEDSRSGDQVFSATLASAWTTVASPRARAAKDLRCRSCAMASAVTRPMRCSAAAEKSGPR